MGLKILVFRFFWALMCSELPPPHPRKKKCNPPRQIPENAPAYDMYHTPVSKLLRLNHGGIGQGLERNTLPLLQQHL